jgi:hypothetical protein
MEADISILRKTGHFYFALTGAGEVLEGAEPVAAICQANFSAILMSELR